MDPTVRRGLERLRDPEGTALLALARLVVDETTETPLAEIATPRWIAGQIAAALEAGTRGDHARRWVDRRIAAERERWGEEERTLRAFVPSEAEDPLRQLLGRAYAPDEDLVHRMIDQPAIRALVREILTDVLHRFRARLQSVDQGLLGGIGKRTAKAGRGLLGNLGGMAENLVGAVREEVEYTLDGRIREFVGGATSETVRSIAAYLADPTHAPAFGQLRLAILDVVLDTPIRELAGEADKMKPEDIVDVVVGALRSAVAQPDFVERTEERVARLLDEAGDGTFGAWLEEVGLREVWTETTTELVAERLKAVVYTGGFEDWWVALFEE